MKKLFVILVSLLLVFSMAGCTSKEEEPAPVEDETLKVAVLLPFIGDQSYFDTLNNGIIKANETYAGKVEVKLYEVGNTTEQATWMAAFDEVCEDGEYDLVVSGNTSYESFLYEACAKYPEQKFMNFDYAALPEGGVPANCYCVNYALDDLGYAVGALSAALTTTGTVGVVVGMDNKAMNQFISGYVQVLAAEGVKYAIYYPGDFQDTTLGYEGTKKLIDAGADVIWQVAGGLGNGVIQACAENESVWCVGVDQDQHAQFETSHPDWAATVITSALKKSDVVIVKVVGMLLDGTLGEKMGKAEAWGIVEDGVGIAENDFYKENCPEEIRNKVTETLSAVVNGEVEVKDTLEMADYDTEWPALRDANRVTIDGLPVKE
jgi:basic membrane protein A